MGNGIKVTKVADERPGKINIEEPVK